MELSAPPVIVISPPPQITVDSSFTFVINCTAMGIPTPEVVWRLNWGHVPDKCSMTSTPQVMSKIITFESTNIKEIENLGRQPSLRRVDLPQCRGHGPGSLLLRGHQQQGLLLCRVPWMRPARPGRHGHPEVKNSTSMRR